MAAIFHKGENRAGSVNDKNLETDIRNEFDTGSREQTKKRGEGWKTGY